MVERKWRIRLGAAAELDFANILKWTAENFGARQSRDYRDTLVRAIGELDNGPEVAGAKARDEIMRGLRTLHVARLDRRGRHFLLCRVASGSIIEEASLKLCESCTTEWTCSATFHLPRTRAANSRSRVAAARRHLPFALDLDEATAAQTTPAFYDRYRH